MLKNNKIIVCKILLTTFFISVLLSCQIKMEEKFDWSGTLSAPEEYPIEVYEGALIAEDYTQDFSSIWGTINPGWGNAGGIVSVGPDEKYLPDSLIFTWLSIAENKFYSGKFRLPKEKMTALFKEGFIDSYTKEKATYKTIVIGLAPKGVVIVWVQASGFQTEVGRFQAHETKIDLQTIHESNHYMFEEDYIKNTLSDSVVMRAEIREKIRTLGFPPTDIYDAYREKYKWHPEVILPEGFEVTFLGFEMCNGEKESTDGKVLQRETRAIPYNFTINLKDKFGRRYGVWIAFTGDTLVWKRNNALITRLPLDFESTDILKIFGTLDKLQQTRLIFRVNDSQTQPAVSIRQGEKETIVKDAVITLFQNN